MKRENEAIWTAAEEANRQCGQWVPQRWIELFIAQLSKTSSGPDNVSNLSGVSSAPNHQPHAVSQGWRTDLENAPGGVRVLIAGRYPNGIWYVEESYRHYAGHFNGRKIDPPTHWMPLPAPPVPETTPRDSSESTTGGAE